MKTFRDAGGADAALCRRILARADPFDGWPPDAMAQLCAVARLGRFGRGQHLRPQDPRVREVVVVGAGFIDVSIATLPGDTFLLGIFGPGHILGILRLMPGTPAAYDYRARDDAIVVQLTSDPILAMLDRQPELWASVARMLLRQYRTALGTIVNRRIGTMSNRVAMLIDNLIDLHGVEGPDGIRLRVRVSQEDLAAMLSTTRQTISKELRFLVAAGVLQVDYAGFVIRDREALRERFQPLG